MLTKGLKIMIAGLGVIIIGAISQYLTAIYYSSTWALVFLTVVFVGIGIELKGRQIREFDRKNQAKQI